MSAIPAIMYVSGIATMGFIWWLLNGIKGYFESLSETTTVVTWLNYVWVGILLLYLIFGGIWLTRTYSEKRYQEM